jgi:hypothetical protein
MSSASPPVVPRSLFGGLLSLLLALSACDDGTGPDPRVELSATTVRPYTVVEVRGLPAAYATSAAMEVRVGSEPAPLMYDSLATIHRFMVPSLPPGRADLVFPEAGGRRARNVTLQVLAPTYAGGTPDAAIAELSGLLDSMQVQTSLVMGTLSAPVDSLLYQRLEASIEVTEVLQDQIAELAPADRAEYAAMFSEQAPMIRDLVAQLSQTLAALRDQPETLTHPIAASMLVPPGTARTAFSSSRELVTTCQTHIRLLERLDQLSSVITWTGIAATAASFLVTKNAPLAGVIAITALRLGGAVDAVVIAGNLVPVLLDPDGLRLDVSPARISHDGGRGTMRAWVKRRAAGEVVGTVVGNAMGLAKVTEAFSNLRAVRALVSNDLIRNLLREIGLEGSLEASLDQLDKALSDYTRNLSGNLTREVPVTFDGIQFTSGQPSARWTFTSGAGDGVRALQTTGQISTPEETVTLVAQLGSGPDCAARTQGTNPDAGINGFKIALEGTLAFVQPIPDFEVRSGNSVTVSATIRNEGNSSVGQVTYVLGHPTYGAWSPLPWMSVTAPSGPATLAAGQTGTVRFTLTTRPDAPDVGVIIPVMAIRNGQAAAAAQIQVNVMPQLSDIVVNRQNSNFRIWDHGAQDGDIITVTLNGSTLVSGFTLTNAGSTSPISYRRGQNVLVIRAHNEGSLSPNTASISFADVVRGSPSQSYGLPTGGTAQLIITYDPDAQPSNARVTGMASLTYRRCAPGESDDCRP